MRRRWGAKLSVAFIVTAKLMTVPVTAKPAVQVAQNNPRPDAQRAEVIKRWWEKSEWWVVIVGATATVFAAGAFFAALWQAIIARRQLHMSQRAWLTVSKAVLSSNIEVGKNISANLDIQNSGPTPALELRLAAAIFSRPELTEATLREIGINVTPGSRLIIGPGVTFIARVTTDTPIDAVQHKRIGEGYLLFVYGFVEYRDVFGERHTTRFCLQTNAQNIEEGAIALQASEYGNVAD